MHFLLRCRLRSWSKPSPYICAQAVATSPCTSQQSSGAAPQQQDDASRPGQQREHYVRSPSSPHQQHAGQYSPPPQENGDQQASCLDRRVVVAPAPLPAAAGVTESVDNQHSPAGANADAVPTAAAAPPSKSHSSSAEKDGFEVCPSCGGVGWVNNDRSSCHICLWSKGDVGSKQGACSPEATVTLAAVASGQGVDMAKKRDGSSKDGQTAAQGMHGMSILLCLRFTCVFDGLFLSFWGRFTFSGSRICTQSLGSNESAHAVLWLYVGRIFGPCTTTCPIMF